MNAKNTATYRQPLPATAGKQENYRTFEDLETYQAAREFRKEMYKVNRRLPAFEKFELGSQIRRAAVSLTNNIAEGHGKFHFPDQIKFMLQARGSLEELLDDLNVCRDESYLPEPEIVKLKEAAWRVYQLLNGYIRYLRSRIAGRPGVLRDEKQSHDISDDTPADDFDASTLQHFDSLR